MALEPAVPVLTPFELSATRARVRRPGAAAAGVAAAAPIRRGAAMAVSGDDEVGSKGGG